MLALGAQAVLLALMAYSLLSMRMGVYCTLATGEWTFGSREVWFRLVTAGGEVLVLIS